MPMTIDFSGKNVLVVGGGRGIGKEIALTFAECGANVVIGDYNAENGEAAAQEIGALGVTGLFYPLQCCQARGCGCARCPRR